MTQDEIIEMARKAGIRDCTCSGEFGCLKAFAKLVAEKATEEANARANASWTLMCKKMVAFEREACAKLCDDAVFKIWEYDPVYLKLISRTVCTNLAKAIRARGEA